MFRLCLTRAVLALVGLLALAAYPRTAHAADLGGYDAPGISYTSPNDRRPLDGSYRYGPMNWTGLYLGGHGGWGAGGSDVSMAVDQTIDISGFLGGLHAGYNYQYQQVVAGVEGDIDWTNADGSETAGGRTFAADADWLSSVRLRLGYAFNNLLIYGTGGVAFGGYNLDIKGAGPDAAVSETLTGFAVGIGAEYAFTHSISARVEAMHYGFGEEDFKLGGNNAAVDLDLTTIRAGLSIKHN